MTRLRLTQYNEEKHRSLAQEWALDHAGYPGEVIDMLPPLGVCVEKDFGSDDWEPIAFLWAHMSVDVGRAFMEMPITRPGLSLWDASEVISFAINGIEEILKGHSYTIIELVCNDAQARFLLGCGYMVNGRKVQMFKKI